jgi:hypothetical protein
VADTVDYGEDLTMEELNLLYKKLKMERALA